MGPYQLENLKGKNRINTRIADKMILEMKKTEAATEFTKLQNEYYVTKMIAQYGSQVVKELMKYIPSGKGGKTPRQADKDFDETTRRMREFGQQKP